MDPNSGQCTRPAKRLKTKTNVEGRCVRFTSKTSEHPLWLLEAPLVSASGLLSNLLGTFEDDDTKTLDIETEIISAARLSIAARKLLLQVLQWLAGQATFAVKPSTVSGALELADFLLCDKLSDAIFSSSDPKVRKKVALLLEEQGEGAAHHEAQLLAWARADSSAFVRTAAKEALASMWGAESLCTRLLDCDEVVREISAMQCLRIIARKMRPATEWKERLRWPLQYLVANDCVSAVQTAAFSALILIDGMERTCKRLESKASFREMAASAIGQLAVQSKSEACQFEAKSSLQFLLPWARDDKHPFVRRAAMSALVKVGAAKELANHFNSSDAREREIAITAFGQLGPEAWPHARKILERLHDELDASVIGAAVNALVNLGIADEYIEELVDVMRGGKLGVQLSVVAAFAKAGASAQLASCLDASHAQVRRKAAMALAELGMKANPFAGELLKRVENDRVASVRKAAATALWMVGPTEEQLRAALEVPDEDVREVVRLAFWQLFSLSSSEFA